MKAKINHQILMKEMKIKKIKEKINQKKKKRKKKKI